MHRINNNAKERSIEVLVTPPMAKYWIEHYNTHNRNVSWSTVDKYARDMKDGKWELTNQGIGFDCNNVLVDGQQRLLACIKANVPFLTFVCRNLDPQSQQVVDGGRLRKVSDQLFLSNNIQNAKLKIAIINMMVDSIEGIKHAILSANTAKQIMDIYENEIETVIKGKGQHIKLLLSAPILTGFVFAAKININKAINFRNQFIQGTNLFLGSPVLTFRNYMLSGKNSVSNNNERNKEYEFTRGL